MASRGGARPNSGRKVDEEVKKLRADLAKMLPSALKAAQAIIDDPQHKDHAMLTKWAVDKIAANPKPQTPPVQFELDGDTPADQARSIIKAAADGVISPSVSAELLAALASAMQIVKTSELLDRLEKIEAANEPR